MPAAPNGAPLAATNEMSAGAICKRRDVVTLGRKKGLQPRANERPAVGCCDELGAGGLMYRSGERQLCFRARQPNASELQGARITRQILYDLRILPKIVMIIDKEADQRRVCEQHILV